MRVFVTGDRHGQFEFLDWFCEEYETDNHDVLIIAGDSGILFFDPNKPREKYTKEFIAKHPITILCVRGNHDARPTHPNYQDTMRLTYNTMLGGMVYTENDYPNIFYAVDGETYDMADKKILTIGGAYSVDKEYRLLQHWTWYEDEQLNESERETIKKHVRGKTYDYVITHTCPISWVPVDMFISGIDQSKVDNTMEEWLEKIEQTIRYDYWFAGHYHVDRNNIEGKHCLLYDRIIQL